MKVEMPGIPSFFVVGYPRSGTTLLASLLNRHSCIAIPPETQFYRVFLEDKKIHNYNNIDDLLEFYCNYPRIKDLNLKPEEFKQYRDAISLETSNLLSASLEIFANRQGKAKVGEKSPGHLLYWKSILRSYPDAKIIFIVRDGRDCVFSNIKQKWTSSDPYKHAADWNVYAKTYEELSLKCPDNVHLIKFEELLISTKIVLSAVCDFIGCEFEEAQLDTKNDNVTVPDWEKKWKSGASDTPDISRIFAWKHSVDTDLINRLSYIMKNDLNLFGYERGGELNFLEWLKLLITEGVYFNALYPVAKLIKKSYKSL